MIKKILQKLMLLRFHSKKNYLSLQNSLNSEEQKDFLINICLHIQNNTQSIFYGIYWGNHKFMRKRNQKFKSIHTQ